MIFYASYLNNHNEIWDVGLLESSNYALSNDAIEKVIFFNMSLTALSTGTGF